MGKVKEEIDTFWSRVNSLSNLTRELMYVNRALHCGGKAVALMSGDQDPVFFAVRYGPAEDFGELVHEYMESETDLIDNAGAVVIEPTQEHLEAYQQQLQAALTSHLREIVGLGEVL